MRESATDLGQRDFLFVQSTTEIGGAETVLLNLFESSEELRRRSVVVTLGFGSGDLPQRLRRAGAYVEEFKMARLRQAWRLVPTFATLRRLARSVGARVVIGNGGHPQLVAGLTARLSGAREAFIAHDIYKAPLWKNNLLEILALMAPCDRVLPVSRAAEGAMNRIRPRLETRLLRNGTPLREVSDADVRAARLELGAAPNQVLVGVFGRLQRWKGQDVFVKAAGAVARLRPEVRFLVVGGATFGFEPEYERELKRDAAALGLGDRIVFTGFRTDVPRLMAACDVVCHTSRVAEPFGLVIVEAMAVGRPVIATAGGGPSEIIESEEYGLLVPPGDADALVKALLVLVEDPERRRRMGANGRERVRAHFSIDAAAALLVRHLDELAGGR